MAAPEITSPAGGAGAGELSDVASARRGPSPLLIRTFVAAILLAVLLGAMAAGVVWISIVIGAFIVIGTVEFYLITRRMGTPAAPWVLFPLTLVLLYRFQLSGIAPWAVPLAIFASVGVGLGVFLVVREPGSSMVRWALALAGAVYLGWSMSFYFGLYTAIDPDPARIGTAWLVALAGSTFLGDTSALLVGSRLGRHRFFPAVSPQKTVEGAIGGFVAQALSFAVLGMLANIPFPHGLVLGGLVAIAAQAGDLIESQFKRSAKVKDASGLLPGHGGLLDRIDSLVLIPGVAYYYSILVLHLRLPQ